MANSLPKRRRVTNPVNSPFASPKAVTQQHLKRESDINLIVERARRGIPPTHSRGPGVYADVSSMPKDLTEAFAAVEHAWDSFMSLPAKAREELGNDPRRLVKADLEFFKRHGLVPSSMSPGETPPPAEGSSGGAGAGTPPKTSKKSSKAAPAATSDQDDQD